MPIALWDERLSTAAVERELIGMDMSRARRAEVIDEHAAIFILQGALDRLANLREDPLRSAIAIAGAARCHRALKLQAHPKEEKNVDS